VDRLSSLGFRTYAAPEIATIVIGAGARPTFPGWTLQTLARFQEGIIRTSIAVEDALEVGPGLAGTALHVVGCLLK
jgi:hypothetical protein